MDCNMEQLMKRKKSIIWSYFTPQSQTKAACNMCNVSLSYRTSISNLMKHVQRKHVSVEVVSEVSSKTEPTLLISNNEDSNGSDSDPQATPKETKKTVQSLKGKRSIIWKYFTPQSQTKATCNMCNASLSYRTSTSNLMKHIQRKHVSIEIVSEISSKTEPTLLISNNEDSNGSDPDPHVTPKNMADSLNKKTVQFSKGKRSIIWKYFTPLNELMATCNICKLSLSYQSTTNNLKKHMQRKHPSVKMVSEIGFKNQGTPLISNNEYPDSSNFDSQASTPHEQSFYSLPATSQPSTSSIVQEYRLTRGNVSKKTEILHKKALDDKLLHLITKDFQPLSIVENIGFQEFTRALNPSYIIPSRKTLSSTLLAGKYEDVKIHTKEMVKSAKSVTITTECWTSYNNESFLAVTAHFINDDFQTNSVMLEVNLCINNHPSDSLAKELSDIIIEWELQNRILLCISDNSINIKEAISKELQWNHLGCFAHKINLIVQDALEVVQPLITKISNIVSNFKRSTEAKIKLDFYQKQNGKEPKKLIQSVCARWTSVYYMLQRMTELKEEVRASMADLGKENWPTLSDREFEIIDELIKILDPMESTTKIMSSEKQVTLSLVIIITNCLQDLYKQFMENNSFSAQSTSVLEKIINGISTRLRNVETNSTLLVTTFLDPRFKHIGFSTDSSAEKAKDLVTDALTAVIEEADEEEKTQRSQPDGSNKLIPVSSIWSSFEKKASLFTPPGSNQRSKAITEIQRYIDHPLLDRTENPIQWWKDNTHTFPYLSHLVRLKFGTVATSVSCQSIFSFSKTEQLLMNRRNLLAANKIGQILFIQQNSK